MPTHNLQRNYFITRQGRSASFFVNMDIKLNLNNDFLRNYVMKDLILMLNMFETISHTEEKEHEEVKF